MSFNNKKKGRPAVWWNSGFESWIWRTEGNRTRKEISQATQQKSEDFFF